MCYGIIFDRVESMICQLGVNGVNRVKVTCGTCRSGEELFAEVAGD